jgi:hypothetical protein
VVESVAGDVDCPHVDNGLLTVRERAGAGTVKQTELVVGPDRIDRVGLTWNADASTSTPSLPVTNTIDAQLGKDLIYGADKISLLLQSVPGSNGDTETFLATGDGWVVDGLNVNVVFR